MITEPQQPEADVERQVRGKLSWRIVPLVAVTALVIVVLITGLSDASSLEQALERARWGWLLAATGLMGVVLALGTLRWRLVLLAMGVSLSYRRALRAVLAAWPFALITPSRAGDLLRSVAIRDRVGMLEGSSSVITERLVDIQSLLLLAALGGLWAERWWLAGLAGLGLVAEWTAALVLLRHRDWLFGLPLVSRLEPRLQRLLRGLDALRQRPASLAAVSLTSMCSWLVAMVLVYCLMQSFGAGVSLAQVIALWPMAIFVGMLPLTLAGMGTRDAAFLYLLGALTEHQEAATLAATLSYAAITTWLPAALGVPWMLLEMRSLGERPRAEDAAVGG